MNKIIYTVLAAVAFLTFSSCSDDQDNPYAHVNTISIVNSKLDFTASEGQGSLHYLSTGGSLTVRSNADWCKAEVVGDSIAVNVSENNVLNGRSTTLILSNGTDTLQVPVTQRGIVCQLAVDGIGITSDDAFSAKYLLNANVDFSVVSVPEWMTASIANDSLSVDVQANSTGSFRKGYVVYQTKGGYRDSVVVFQADFDKDIAGAYTFNYNLKNGTKRQFNATLSKTGLKLTSSWTVPISFDATSGKITVTSGSYVGRSGANYIYLAYGLGTLEDNLWTSYNVGLEMTASLEHDEQGNVQAVFGGNVSGYAFSSWILRPFKTQSMTQDNDMGSGGQTFYGPYLSRETAKTAE